MQTIFYGIGYKKPILNFSLNTPGEKLGLKFTPPVIAISNSISICINKHTS